MGMGVWSEAKGGKLFVAAFLLQAINHKTLGLEEE